MALLYTDEPVYVLDMGPQLTLPGVPLDPQAVVPIEPQPWQTQKGWWLGGSVFVGDWNWEHHPGVTTCTNHPETSEGWLRYSPFQPGMEYEDGAVIESVRPMLISTGWVWVLTLRSYHDDDLTPFWQALRPPEPRPEPDEPEDFDDLL